MDRAGFEIDEQERGLRKSLTEKAIKEVARLEGFLALRSKGLETTTIIDLEEYLEERTMSTVALLDVHGLGRYFKYLGNDAVVQAIAELRLRYTTPFKLNGLLDVDPAHIAALESMGIRTNNQLLRRGTTTKARAQLAQDAGIPKQAMEKIARLSDLVRMRGVRAIRAKLYFDMGIQTVVQMAQWSPQELVKAAQEYVEHSDYEGIATLPKEARFTVDLANRLPQLADFS